MHAEESYIDLIIRTEAEQHFSNIVDVEIVPSVSPLVSFLFLSFQIPCNYFLFTSSKYTKIQNRFSLQRVTDLNGGTKTQLSAIAHQKHPPNFKLEAFSSFINMYYYTLNTNTAILILLNHSNSPLKVCHTHSTAARLR